MIESGSARKYLLYAIGEIALVVIGILIALQVNNWNENRKEIEFAKDVVSELNADLMLDIGEMERALESLNTSQKSADILLNHFKKDLPYHDSLDFHFSSAIKFWSFTSNASAFEMAKSEGLYTIQNDSIRILISIFYEYRLEYQRVLEDRFNMFYHETIVPICLDLFERVTFHEPIKPINYENLKTHAKYTTVLKSLKVDRTNYYNWLLDSREILLRLASFMEEELNQ